METYYQNLTEIAIYCQSNNINLVLCTPIPASYSNETSPEYLAHISDLCPVIHRVCQERGCQMINLYNEVTDFLYYRNDTYADNYLADGLHPNDKLYELMLYWYIKGLGLGEAYDGKYLRT